MNTLAASKKWNCSMAWVRDRCTEGMIPLAEKNGIWDIPETADKPPCTRHRAAVLLQRLQEKSEGNDVELFPGNDKDTNIAIYKYLANYGFITRLKGKKIEKEIGAAKVLKPGLELMESEEKKKKPSVSKRTKITGGVQTDHAKLEIEHEISTSDKTDK